MISHGIVVKKYSTHMMIVFLGKPPYVHTVAHFKQLCLVP